MQFDDKNLVEKAKRRAVVNQTEAKNRVELFRHLPQYERELSFQISSQSFFNLIFKVNVNVEDFISDELIEYIHDRCDKRNENSIPCSIDKITKGKAGLDFGVHSLTSNVFQIGDQVKEIKGAVN
ncbi:hypothetical protein RchiOBHm_Chr2g0112321 [Rosa chinensis]|uniref:Uncharacterized protein n=1 Tax=Rosa chinensis TaxID=74649 RepID=A0A2P6RQC0_ROSCH|nr:uncharacterized protein LOC121051877 [Rosa chinensis]PRQ48581.1 hypothetical protein RchiOBHm_Chr2g0112321 [Rosa chinensis]